MFLQLPKVGLTPYCVCLCVTLTWGNVPFQCPSISRWPMKKSWKRLIGSGSSIRTIVPKWMKVNCCLQVNIPPMTRVERKTSFDKHVKCNLLKNVSNCVSFKVACTATGRLTCTPAGQMHLQAPWSTFHARSTCLGTTKVFDTDLIRTDS